ncbi:response regulator [Flavobacterium noncentrifugens]|uniref:Response regulator receiver domain-containing protein n=1 Tax=Flavobacterium noncentrifugens TaxID=1128970 RepID=A0A1G8RS18_9FLAO|nr:response regulator [Flavobacterium noncentrifugens]GEP49557.1 response regulator [Flavobacterium noncentrifugens]SDJ19791.1 Response regulator receiver domain-containing protein [Flavobacterium noncentrifugens]
MNTNSDQMNIFLADDDEDDRSLFKLAFDETKLNSNLSLFKSGNELMDFLNQDNLKLPHILFLDLNMPGKTGAQCLAEIKANPKFRNMSIAIYSTSNSEKDIEDTLSGGANIYIHKPNDFQKLKQIIKHVLKINWQYHTSGLNRESFFLSI